MVPPHLPVSRHAHAFDWIGGRLHSGVRRGRCCHLRGGASDTRSDTRLQAHGRCANCGRGQQVGQRDAA